MPLSPMTLRSHCLTLILVLASILGQAQPHPYGCHYFRQTPGPLQFTQAARDQIEETIARSDTFDILHYDIHLDLTSPQAAAFKAFTTITFTPLLADQQHIRFDLFQLTVDSVVHADGPLTFSHDGQFLTVQADAPFNVGGEYQVTVHYHGTPHRDPEWGGFYYEGGYIYNLGIGLSTIPPNFGKVWYPCFDSFVERATYTYHVKSAGGRRLHGQGELVSEVQLGGDTLLRTFELSQAVPTHISAVAVSTYRDSNFVHLGANGEVPVRLTARPSQMAGLLSKFGDIGSAIDVCEHWYGPHMYDRVGYVLTTDGALEIPTNIAYPDFMTGQSVLENRALFTHELGHHWWGDHITPHVHNDMWLKEGPAEYSGHLIEEWIGGRTPFIKAVKDNHNFILRQAHRDDDGFQPLSPMPDPHIYGTHTYKKGASVMHNLRGYLGDALFQQALRGVQADHAERTITAAQFRDALEAHSGVDLHPFFDAWVFAPGYSVFEVRQMTVSPNGGAWTADLEIGQKLYGASVMHQQVPLDVTFLAPSGEVFEAAITASGEFDQASIEVPFNPAMVVLNRAMRLNQARMDHEITLVPGVNFANLLPYVEFRLYANSLVDSTLVRVEHIYGAPDQQPVQAGVSAISDVHYWVVDGLWPEGTDLEGHMYYLGENANQYDHALVNGDETGMVLLWRPTANDTWSICPDQAITAGSLTNGSGLIRARHMRKGQYTFGKAEAIIGVEERAADQPFSVVLAPVPASSVLAVSGHFDGQGNIWWDIIGADGRIAQRTTGPIAGTYRQEIDVQRLAPGMYLLRATHEFGGRLFEQRFEVIH